MDIASFKMTIAEPQAPENLPVQLSAMWYDAKGEWAKAHSLVDQLSDEPSCWVHAYLHRKEGDIWNADYWYRRAGKRRPEMTVQQEWAAVAEALLKDYN